ncbi:MAG: YihY/virulence factor BrkB family protein [Oscillospiraceae bacterium]|nr:YihY/virulence factor BrkB family protein [Oscillospiraceae bacterium]
MKKYLCAVTQSAKRCFRTAVSYIKNLKYLYDGNHIAAYSAQAAFFVLMSLVPLVLLVTIILGTAPFVNADIQSFLEQILSEKAIQKLLQLTEQLRERPPVPFLSVTMLFVLWAATNGIRSIAHGLGNIFGGAERYNIIQITLRSVGYAAVMFAVGLFSVIVLVFASPLEAAATAVLGDGAKIVLVVLNLRNVIFFAAFTLLFAIAYKGLAKSSLNFKQQLLGASVAALGWILYSFGFSVYIKYFSRYSILYGSFGAVMLFMLWLYMCMNILLCGALINRLLYSKKCD